MNTDNRVIAISQQQLDIIEALAQNGDVRSLGLMHDVHVAFIMNAVIDRFTSFVDLNEYIDELIEELDKGRTFESVRDTSILRSMILNDISVRSSEEKDSRSY